MVRQPSREIRVPFQVGSDGGIAWTDDPVIQAMQHVLSVVVTNPGERVMRPDYGVPVYSALFNSNDEIVQSDLRSRMDEALGRWLPNVEIVVIDFIGTNDEIGLMEFNIQFRLTGSPTIHTATINVGGAVTETIHPLAQE